LKTKDTKMGSAKPAYARREKWGSVDEGKKRVLARIRETGGGGGKGARKECGQSHNSPMFQIKGKREKAKKRKKGFVDKKGKEKKRTEDDRSRAEGETDVPRG